MTATIPDALALADWRRRIAEVYAGVRAVPNHGFQAWQGWRAVRDDLIGNHLASPLSKRERGKFKPLSYFDYDPKLRFLVDTVTPADRGAESVSLTEDGIFVMEPVAETRGLAEALGGELTIFWVNGYGGGLFLPFSDAGNGVTTYRGGRYLIDGIKGADLGAVDDGRLVLDFNFAYNPSCAYSPRWSCPLAPERNRLPMAVQAGEKHMAKH